jgi:peptide deformylase
MPTPAQPANPVYAYGEAILRTVSKPIPLALNDNHVVTTDPKLVPWTIPQLQKLADALAQSMYGGGAIAAPQAGQQWRMFLVKNSEIKDPKFPFVTNPQAKTHCDPPVPYQIFINPVISNKSKATWLCQDEGCLSFPGYSNGGTVSCEPGYVPVNTTRHQTFTLTYQTISYGPAQPGHAGPPVPMLVTKTYQGNQDDCQTNWVLQHEVDHLDGVLFIDYSAVPANDSTNGLYLNKIETGTLDWGNYPIIPCVSSN